MLCVCVCAGLIEENLEPTDQRRSPWRCRLCLKEFTSKGNARRHVETMHCETPSLTCALCHKVLKNKNSHSNHMIIIHGLNRGSRMKPLRQPFVDPFAGSE
jgi:5-methylcytosine-specific restriction endonuclease McrA